MPVKHSIVLSGFSLNTWIKSNTNLLIQDITMKTFEINFLLIVGFLMTMGGVGTIEISQTDMDMISGLLVSILGLAVMYCGLLAMKVVDNK